MEETNATTDITEKIQGEPVAKENETKAAMQQIWLSFVRFMKGDFCVRKYDFISALAQETAREVVRNRDEWMKYLTTAARL